MSANVCALCANVCVACACVCQLDRVIFCVFLPTDKELYLQNLPLYFPPGEPSAPENTNTHFLEHRQLSSVKFNYFHSHTHRERVVGRHT